MEIDSFLNSTYLTEIKISLSKDGYQGVACVFWNEAELQWSNEGCEIDTATVDSAQVECRCTHLTDFSLILGFKSEEEYDWTLNLVSYIVCGLSIMALVMTQVIKHCFK